MYLLQGLVLAAVLRGPFFRQRDLQSPIDHWLLSLLVAMVLIAVATAVHLWVESPGILLGKLVGTALSGSLWNRDATTRAKALSSRLQAPVRSRTAGITVPLTRLD